MKASLFLVKFIFCCYHCPSTSYSSLFSVSMKIHTSNSPRSIQIFIFGLVVITGLLLMMLLASWAKNLLSSLALQRTLALPYGLSRFQLWWPIIYIYINALILPVQEWQWSGLFIYLLCTELVGKDVLPTSKLDQIPIIVVTSPQASREWLVPSSVWDQEKLFL